MPKYKNFLKSHKGITYAIQIVSDTAPLPDHRSGDQTFHLVINSIKASKMVILFVSVRFEQSEFKFNLSLNILELFFSWNAWNFSLDLGQDVFKELFIYTPLLSLFLIVCAWDYMFTRKPSVTCSALHSGSNRTDFHPVYHSSTVLPRICTSASIRKNNNYMFKLLYMSHSRTAWDTTGEIHHG